MTQELEARLRAAIMPMHIEAADALQRYREALEKIAALDDHAANTHLRVTGSWAGFDEPGSVETARAALNPKDATDD